jgi:hypothetical protein
VTVTLADAHDLWIVILERHQDDDESGLENAVSDWIGEVSSLGISEHNAVALLNKLTDHIAEARDRAGTNPN